MKFNIASKNRVAVFVWIVVVFFLVATSHGEDPPSVCASGVAEPPFLSYGVDPNVLLMIDNSGSMLDPAYIGAATQCYDDTYDLTGTASYAGYFEKSSWYSYDFTTNTFTKSSSAPGFCATGEYYGHDSSGDKYLCLDLDTATAPDTVLAFAAKGRFLNWAASSKFDIQKKILTGGKYDSSNHLMLLESRGCSGRRFVKQVALAQTSEGKPYKLALGVRGPMEVYDAWRPNMKYSQGFIVQYMGVLYKAKTAFTSYVNFSSANWEIYKGTRWYPGHTYSSGASVYDVTSDSWYWTEKGGSSLTTALKLSDDTSIIWEPFHGTEIEIFDIQVEGMNVAACQAAIDEMGSLTGADDAGEKTRLGQLKAYTKECMGYENANPNSEEGARQSVFNASMQECWYYNKFGCFQPGSGTVTDLQNQCFKLYDYINPPDVSAWDSGYVCYGSYTTTNPKTSTNGYIGRCWEPASSVTTYCTSSCGSHAINTVWSENNIYYSCKISSQYAGGGLYRCGKSKADQCELMDNSWELQETCSGGGSLAVEGWTDDDDDDDGYVCVDTAIKDFCGLVSVPEVIDPSDSTQTGQTWNLPAMLIDSGVMGQLDKPLAIMKGRIAEANIPSGVIQKNVDKIRIGAMRFNHNGADTECDLTTTQNGSIRYACPDNNRDGANVMSDIDKSSDHTVELIKAINSTEANSWTPLGEAMFTAIGYYTQNEKYRCQTTLPADFTVGVDPIQYWCQNNHIILITDGSSTADRNAQMIGAVNGAGGYPKILLDNDANNDGVEDSTPDQVCNDGLYGSTYLDNFIYHAARSSASTLYPVGNSQLASNDNVMKNKQNIKTHIIVSGSLRVTGSSECSPSVIMPEAANNAKLNPADIRPYYESENYDQLENNLNQVFAEIRSGASAGSAASVISSSGSGEGFVVQATFWPVKNSTTNMQESVSWVGDVHAFFVDSTGYMYEDTTSDGQLSQGDKRVVIYFDVNTMTSKGCYEIPINGTCSADKSVDLDEIRYIWSANDWLAKISNSAFSDSLSSDENQYKNRNPFLSDTRRRYIFTWNDLDNDGIVDSGEQIDFASKSDIGELKDWSGYQVSGGRRPVANDFHLENAVTVGNEGVNNNEINRIVDWIRGVEIAGLRSRTVDKKIWDNDVLVSKKIVWRLGDIVHSTPTIVAKPAEALHLIYGDTTYSDFVARWEKRRHMAYFGANDGMLHAVNAGFYNQDAKKFCLSKDCANESGQPELGAEMWAYVPYNLLPHLKCLTAEHYAHKYYVDQRPRIFDAKIFTHDDEHRNGWGTVLIGAMRFGGARVKADTLSQDDTTDNDNRYFTSSYFVLDITNPDKEPVLLGEFTMLEDVSSVDLGFTTAIPTPVVMKDDAGDNEWYLLMGSGPTVIDEDGSFDAAAAIQGVSSQKPRVAVLPLKWLTTDKKPFRIPNTLPTESNQSGVFVFEGSSNGFVSDLITVDYNLEREYKSDAAYFGTVEHGANVLPLESDQYNDVWDGNLYRIVMRKVDNNGDQTVTEPYDWLQLTPKDAGSFAPLFNPGQPITAAPSVGTDGHNFWVYFGTGRFYDAGIDKKDNAQQSFYGIKELTDCEGGFTWTSNIQKTASASDNGLGSRGLVDVTDILVQQGGNLYCSLSELQCVTEDDEPCEIISDSCLPQSDIITLAALTKYIAGSGSRNGSSCVDTDSDGTLEPTGKDGWFRDFPVDSRPRERNIGQATLLGGLLTFTTYQPYEDQCLQEGQSYLYGLHYQTGTPWYDTVFGERGISGKLVFESIFLGRGMTTTPSLHTGSNKQGPTAFIQTSTGEIIEVQQTNLPINNYNSGRQSWKER